MTRVLLVGNLYDDKWLGSLVRGVKSCNSNIQIDFFNVNITNDASFPNFAKFCNKIFLVRKRFPSFLYRIPKVRGILMQFDIYLEFRDLCKKLAAEKSKYDLINIHYIRPVFYYCINMLLRMSKNVLLSPWGSDILRAGRLDLKKLTLLSSEATYVSCGRNAPRFRDDIIRLLGVSENKLVNIGFGTEMIDVISAHPEINRKVAKEKLGLNGNYIIVCGYNAHEAQNHIKVIEAIASRKDLLPDNLLLLLPMTYGKDKKYVAKVEKKVMDSGLSYRILQDYLSNEDLLNVRKCADMFIHAQTTDANSGSLAEYLLCKSKVINASWLKYPHREKYGKPYYVFENFDTLGDVIVRAYNDKSILIENQLIEDILQDGWSKVGVQWGTFYNACSE